MISNKPTSVNEFSAALRQQLQEKIEKALETHNGPRIAAFDADGTLWDMDMGENFFDHQIHHNNLPDLPADPWQHYHDLKKVNPTVAYVWLAQINKGQELARVRQWAREAVDKVVDVPIFESQKWFVQYLKSLDFEVYVVTASIKWAVEPAAHLYNIDFDHVLGITTEVIGGRVTDVPVHPLTWRQGKADGLLAATKGVRPLVASGNTLGDIALLDTAQTISLAIRTQSEHNSLFEEEEKLFQHASTKGWPIHRFR